MNTVICQDTLDINLLQWSVGGYVTEENFCDYLEAFELRTFELTAVNELKVKEIFTEYNGFLIWMDNFDKVRTSFHLTDNDCDYEADEV